MVRNHYRLRYGAWLCFGDIPMQKNRHQQGAYIQSCSLADPRMHYMCKSLVLGQAMGRWGNFVNQEAYGNQIANPSLCFFPYGVYIEEIGQCRQATFFYESALNLALLTAMLTCCPHFRQKGYLLPGIRVSQVLSGCLIILGIVILFIIRKRQAVRQ